jgi:hypothetical protein
MADKTAQTCTWDGSVNPALTGTEPTATQVFSNVTPNTTILIVNNSLASVDVTLKNQVQDDWGSVVTTQDEVHAIDAGEFKALSGPFLCEKFRDTDGDVTVTTSAQTDVKIYMWHRGP